MEFADRSVVCCSFAFLVYTKRSWWVKIELHKSDSPFIGYIGYVPVFVVRIVLHVLDAQSFGFHFEWLAFGFIEIFPSPSY